MKLAATAAIAPLLVAVPLMGQNEIPHILFHVTSVERAWLEPKEADHYCATEKCSANRFTVRGYRVDSLQDGKVVEYVLDCVETMEGDPNPHLAVQCPRVHAHNNYNAELTGNDDAIFFGDGPSVVPGKPFVAAYDIESEREVERIKENKLKP